MPGRNNTGSGSIFRQSGKMTRSVRNIADNKDELLTQKRTEKAMREAYRKERKLASYLAEDENFPSFRIQMTKMGLQLRDIPADGNCLFRALGDQLEGHCRNHFRHRTEVVNYMRSNRHDFEPFVEDDVSFDEHLLTLQKLGTHAGNDAIVAFARLHNVNIIIHQLNGKPLMIQGPGINSETSPQLHLAYHNGDHYSSVRKIDDNTESPPHIRLLDPESHMRQYKKKNHDCNGSVRVKRSLEDMETEVALATNCLDQERVRQVLCECDYDVDASIADLLQQMELSSEDPQDDSTSLTSQQTSTTDNGMWNAAANNSSASSLNYVSGHISHVTDSTEKNQDMVNGNNQNVHARNESIGSGSGYGSLSSYNSVGARPKVVPIKLAGQRKTKESKKMEKKKRAEERRREKILGVHQQNIPEATTVVSSHNGQLTRI